MRKYRPSNQLSQRGIYLRKSITATQSRAQFVGVLYLLAIIALAAAACLPLLVSDLAPVGVMEFWKVFTPKQFKNFCTFSPFDLKFSNVEYLVKLANSVLYALMLLGVVINVLRAFGRLGWLFQKKACRSYGFNRNVYAMEDLGHIFSGSFAALVVTYFLIALLAGSTNVNLLMLIVLGAGVAIHLVLGFIGAKTTYHDVADMVPAYTNAQTGVIFKYGRNVVERKRKVGRFACLFRNILQIAAVGAIMFFFFKVSLFEGAVLFPEINYKKKFLEYFQEMENLIPILIQGVMILCLFVLIKHATATTEYRQDGRHGAAMGFFSFLVFALAVAGIVYQQFVLKDGFNTNLLIIAAIALGMMIVEIIMRKMPKLPCDKIDDEHEEAEGEEEFTLDYILRAQVDTQPVGMPEMQSF